jgi:4-hydroxy-tetrahydrodipicolinate synthase
MFHGSIVALVTPMKVDGEVDFDSLHRLVEMHLERGTDAIAVCVTTSESPTLEPHERDKIIREVVRHAKGHVPVIAGTGTYSTCTSIQLTKEAMEAGVDACLLITPYYNKPNQEGLYQHYRAVAKAMPIPLILYNNPSRTGCDMLPETVARLSEMSNIVGIKEGNLERCQKILEMCGDKLDVLSGDDITGLDIMSRGGKGIISVTANIAPKEIHDICNFSLNSRLADAKQLNDKLIPVYKNLFVDPNPIPVKWVMNQMGLIPPGIRLPLTPLSAQYHDIVRKSVVDAHILK